MGKGDLAGVRSVAFKQSALTSLRGDGVVWGAEGPVVDQGNIGGQQINHGVFELVDSEVITRMIETQSPQANRL
jgi:hypothetical protein